MHRMYTPRRIHKTIFEPQIRDPGVREQPCRQITGDRSVADFLRRRARNGTITDQDSGREQHIALAGFHFHRVDEQFHFLVNGMHRVAVSHLHRGHPGHALR